MTTTAQTSSQRKLSCPRCTFTTTGKYPKLHQHIIKAHPMERKPTTSPILRTAFRCPHCRMEFTNLTAVAIHVSRVHPKRSVPTLTNQNAKRYKCSQCKYTTSDAVMLAGHIARTHYPKHPDSTASKPSTCSKCGQILSNWLSAAIHTASVHKSNK